MRDFARKYQDILPELVLLALAVVVVAILLALVLTTDRVAYMEQKMVQCLESEVFTREECITIITSDQDRGGTTVVIPVPSTR